MRNIEVYSNQNGHWIHVRTEDNKYGAICVENVIQGPLTREAFMQWINERIEEGEVGDLIS